MEVAYPQNGSSCTWFLVELEFGKSWFLRRGENRSTRSLDLNPGHIGGRRALSPLRHPLLPVVNVTANPSLFIFVMINNYLLYRYWWNTRIFPFTKKSYLHRSQWRYYFYLSRVRILVSPWLLTWLANYKRASRSKKKYIYISIVVFISPL